MRVPERIAFIRTDRLGEVLLTLPAVAALRAAYPNARVCVSLDPLLCELLEGSPGVDAWLPFRLPADAPWWHSAAALARRLRPGRFDLAVMANPHKAVHSASLLAGIPVRVGYDRKWGCVLTRRLPDRKALGDRHEVEYNLELVRALGVEAPVLPWRFPAFTQEQGDIHQLLAAHGLAPSEPFIVVHPWTSNPAKRWPADRFREIVRRARDALRAAVVIAGQSPGETWAAPAQTTPGVVDTTNRLTLRQLAALLQRARVLVSGDSGPMHLAAALGTPTVALFGTPSTATGPRRWGPWGTGHAVIWRPSMEAISVDEVLETVRRRWHGGA